MKKVIALAVCAAVLMLANSVEASIVKVGDQIKLYSSAGRLSGFGGGQFDVDILGQGTTNDFGTFCAEIGEFINFGTKYQITGLGFQSQESTPVNVLSVGAAKLYRAFYDAQKAGAASFSFGSETFTFGNGNDQKSLQQALWTTIGETDSGVGTLTAKALSWVTYINNQGWNVAATAATSHGVRIMNLQKVNSDGSLGALAQDQFAVVPEPTSLMIWGVAGLGMIGAGARRRRQA